jgi:glucan phosphoethanolaminetransferase (alkaline phosphatase superfamily)
VNTLNRTSVNIRLLICSALFILSTSSVSCFYILQRIWQTYDTMFSLTCAVSVWACTTIIVLVILFKSFTVHRYIFYPLSLIVFVINTLANAASYQMESAINPSMIHAAMLSPFEDIASFVTWQQIALFCLGMVGFALHCLILGRACQFKDAPPTYGLCTILSCILLFSDSSTAMSDQPPFQAVKPLVKMMLPSHDAPLMDATEFSTQDKKPRTIVLVIGESARSDHFQLNGYARATNPYLSTLAHIVSYPDVKSCAALTHTSLTCMLTDATLDDFKDSTSMIPKWGFSMIEGFKRAHFYTGWIGMQGYRGLTPIPYLQIADSTDMPVFPGANISFGKPPYDEVLLPYVDSFLKKYPEKSKLLIIHLYGSHFPYDTRYPDTFKKFTPTCGSTSEVLDLLGNNLRDCDKKVPNSVTNSYDNSLIYTDYVLSEIIKKLDSKHAMLMYVSDHGESLGENGNYIHGRMSIPEQRTVPMIFWASPSFIQDYPNQWQHIEENQHQALSHDNVFHSLLHCAGIQSPRVHDDLSVCSPYIQVRHQ